MKLPLFFLLLAVMLSSGGCGAPGGERRSLEPDFNTENHPAQESWNMTLYLTDAGIRKGSVKAGHAAEYRNREKNTYYLDSGVMVVFYGRNGNPSTTIRADKAVIHENQDIDASGNVVVTAGDNTVIRTAYLRRTAKDAMIRSSRHVTITRKDGTIQGQGFESDQSLKRYRIFQGSGEGLIK